MMITNFDDNKTSIPKLTINDVLYCLVINAKPEFRPFRGNPTVVYAGLSDEVPSAAV